MAEGTDRYPAQCAPLPLDLAFHGALMPYQMTQCLRYRRFSSETSGSERGSLFRMNQNVQSA